MSSTLPIQGGNITAPTPQNTPLNQAPIALGLSRPTVPDITEDDEQAQDGANTGGDADVASGSGDAIHNTMLGLVQGKLAALVGASSGYIEGLPNDVKRNLEGLKGVQSKYNTLQNAYKRECLELEKKYLQLAQPLYQRRTEIINGTAPATEEEITAGEELEKKDDPEYEAPPKDVAPSKEGIPEFWLTALRNHMALSELITDRDSAALKHLIDVRLEYLTEGENPESETQGRAGFVILFEFSPNEFFENKILEKKYLYQKEVGYTGDFVYERALGTKIQWKEDKDLTKEFEIKKQRNKNTNRTRLVRKARPTDSFFNFFDPPTPPTEEQLENGDFEEEDIAELEDKLEVDYQIGEDLKEKIIPHAVDYFTGRCFEWEMDDDDDYLDEDEDDEDGDVGDSDEDSGSDNDVPVRRRGGGAPKGGRRGGGAAAPAGGNDECKQQ